MIPANEHGEQVYEVEAVVNDKIEKCKRSFRVSWKGHSSYAWEPEEHLLHAQAEIEQYFTAHPSRREATEGVGVCAVVMRDECSVVCATDSVITPMGVSRVRYALPAP